MPITKVFGKEDTDLYSTWHLEEGGIVCLVVPDMGEIRMTLAKAEEISKSIAAKAEYGRWAAFELANVQENIADGRFEGR